MRRPAGILLVVLVAFLAALAVIVSLSRRHARRVRAPITSSEPVTAPPAAEPPAAPATATAAAAAAVPVPSAAPAPHSGAMDTNGRQVEISRVIREGRPGLSTCYQRALVRDATLVHGRLTVRASISPAGRVDDVRIAGPAAFRPMQPCLEEAVSRWTFPAAAQSYTTEFPLVLQGNE